MEKVKKKKEIYERTYFSLAVISIILFLFFSLNFFHLWASSLPISLHFCDHSLCVIYSLIWFIVFFIFVYFFIKEKDMKKEEKEEKEKQNKKNKIKKWFLICSLILIIGIILMNIIPCNNNGKFYFFGTDFFNNEEEKPTKEIIGDEEENKIRNLEIEEGNEGNFVDSDGGRIFDVRGIISWEGNTTKEDFCLDNYILKEYSSPHSSVLMVEEIDCRDFYGLTACCSEGRCLVDCNIEEKSCEEVFEMYEKQGEKPTGWGETEEECNQICEENCEYGIKWCVEKIENCCLWKCEEKIDENETICQESDFGLNVTIPGTCDDGDNYSDYCIDGSKLMEYYCSDNSCQGTEWQCNKKCVESDEGSYCT